MFILNGVTGGIPRMPPLGVTNLIRVDGGVDGDCVEVFVFVFMRSVYLIAELCRMQWVVTLVVLNLRVGGDGGRACCVRFH